MNKKIYITKYNDFQMMAVYENEQLAECYADKPGDSGILDRVYIGKVKNVVNNIQAAFIDIGGVEGYYSLEENKSHFFLNEKNGTKLVPGDELLVQVSRENVKTKAPTLTSMLSFAGKYMVLKAKKPVAAVSSKITCTAEKERLKHIFEAWVTEDYGFVIRTKAAGVSEDILFEEMCTLKEKYEQIIEKSKFLSCFSEVYKEPDEYIRRVLTLEDEHTVKIMTDIPEVYEALKENHVGNEAQQGLVFYEDNMLPLVKLLNLETQIERALKPQVWLKSGGSLVITATEAMVVIDVNTGKFSGKKKLEDTFFKTNVEAAKEIIHQLRLRNLSGIILIDFIDMKSPEMKKMLMDTLRAEAAKDPVKTVVVDMTKLNLVEMTRRKERKPLHEQMTSRCPMCKGRGYL